MSNSTVKLVCIPLIVLVVAAAMWWMRKPYQGISDHGYEITVALYSACNAKSESRIDQIEALVDASLNEDRIGPHEAAWFEDVVQTARAGQWRDAARQSRAILSAQVQPN